ncbi:MAG: hypothetical protein ACREHG_03980 [Candidatus Saccharimonadales bacterium]
MASSNYFDIVSIRRGEGFKELYADTGLTAVEDIPAPNSGESEDDMGEWTFRAIKEYDRKRSGGIVGGE